MDTEIISVFGPDRVVSGKDRDKRPTLLETKKPSISADMPGFVQLFSFLDLRCESGESGFKSRRGRQNFRFY
jgi:hypothetical protein